MSGLSYTVADISKLLKVRQHQILGLLRSGQLRGVNVAIKANGKPRWRILESDLEGFLARRTLQIAGPRKRRRRSNRKVIEFFK